MEAREPTDLLVRASGLSRRAFAKQFGVGEQVLLRLSQGRFTRVPESIVEALQACFDPDQGSTYSTQIRQMLVEGYGTGDLQDAYRAWREHARPFGDLPSERALKQQDRALSPAKQLAAAVGSMSKLAKILRVHDYVVRRYVSGETRELPASMRESMVALKWPHADQLDRAQQFWLDQQEAK